MIAIIGLLASVVLASLGSARASARDARRVSELKELQKAVELYFSVNGVYPTSVGCDGGAAGGQWRGHGSGYGNCDTNYIENLTPYMATLPIDPSGDNVYGYIYRTNAARSEYKIMSFNVLESNTMKSGDVLARCPSSCSQNYCQDTATAFPKTYAVYSPGAACW